MGCKFTLFTLASYSASCPVHDDAAAERCLENKYNNVLIINSLYLLLHLLRPPVLCPVHDDDDAAAERCLENKYNNVLKLKKINK